MLKKINFGKAAKYAGEFWSRNDTRILSGSAIAGVFITFGLSIKAGMKLNEIIKEKKAELEIVDPDDKATKKKVIMEGVKEAAPSVAAAAVMGFATAGAIFGSHTKSERKIAGLSAAYTIADQSLKDLNGKMEELLGQKKTREIKDAIMKDKVEEKGTIDTSSVIVTGNGNVLCMDSFSGQMCYTNANKIGQVINQLSGRCTVENYITLNELYGEIGFRRTSNGDDFGWNVDDLINYQLPIVISTQLTEDMQPCLCLDYDVSQIRRKLGDML